MPVVNRQFIALFVLAFAFVFSLPLVNQLPIQASPRSTAPTVQIQYKYYPVSGATASELRSQMNRLGPRDRYEDRTYDANTDWAVRWSYRYAMRSNRCVLQNVNTRVAITYTLPKWKKGMVAERSLVADWNRYMAALQLHEDGHKNHGVEAGRDVQQVLSKLPSAASCAELETQAQAAARTVIKTYNQKDLDYDHMTRHGSTQGAIFPSAATVSR